jgi:hypothetical protein
MREGLWALCSHAPYPHPLLAASSTARTTKRGPAFSQQGGDTLPVVVDGTMTMTRSRTWGGTQTGAFS